MFILNNSRVIHGTSQDPRSQCSYFCFHVELYFEGRMNLPSLSTVYYKFNWALFLLKCIWIHVIHVFVLQDYLLRPQSTTDQIWFTNYSHTNFTPENSCLVNRSFRWQVYTPVSKICYPYTLLLWYFDFPWITRTSCRLTCLPDLTSLPLSTPPTSIPSTGDTEIRNSKRET